MTKPRLSQHCGKKRKSSDNSMNINESDESNKENMNPLGKEKKNANINHKVIEPPSKRIKLSQRASQRASLSVQHQTRQSSQGPFHQTVPETQYENNSMDNIDNKTLSKRKLRYHHNGNDNGNGNGKSSQTPRGKGVFDDVSKVIMLLQKKYGELQQK